MSRSDGSVRSNGGLNARRRSTARWGWAGPLIAARILRRLDRVGLLGTTLRVAGTHALYAYERMAAVHFASEHLTTLDIDLLYDARASLDFLSAEIASDRLIGQLRKVDRSFVPTGKGSFRAANDEGFLVDLIAPMPRNPASGTVRSRVGTDPSDLAAVEIAGLAWLESSPAVWQIVIDERGFPLILAVPDPRAFALHKDWLSRRGDRDPASRRRDAAQARSIVAMLAVYRPELEFNDASLKALPKAMRARAPTLSREAKGEVKGLSEADL